MFSYVLAQASIGLQTRHGTVIARSVGHSNNVTAITCDKKNGLFSVVAFETKTSLSLECLQRVYKSRDEAVRYADQITEWNQE